VVAPAALRASRPRIGLTAATETARYGAWEQPTALLPQDYVSAVRRAGGRPVLLVPDEDPAAALDDLDALVLTGGADLDPATYGAPRDPATGPAQPERDAFERALTRDAIDRDLPLLAICRGVQIAAVAAGGTLHQHLPDLLAARGDAAPERHRRHAGTLDARNAHPVELVPGSLAARACEGATRTTVRSHHHQAVAEAGDGWTVTGRSPDDGVIEAIERPDRRFCLGVQWHPEGDPATTLFAALVAAARAAPPRRPAGGDRTSSERTDESADPRPSPRP
jgi:putative glutamine amidotransferase